MLKILSFSYNSETIMIILVFDLQNKLYFYRKNTFMVRMLQSVELYIIIFGSLYCESFAIWYFTASLRSQFLPQFLRRLHFRIRRKNLRRCENAERERERERK